MSAAAGGTIPGEAWKFQRLHAEHTDENVTRIIDLALNRSLTSGRVKGAGEITEKRKEWISPELPPIIKIQRYRVTDLVGRWGKFSDTQVVYVSGQVSGEPELPLRGDFEGIMCLAQNWRGAGDFRYLGETHTGVPVKPEPGT